MHGTRHDFAFAIMDSSLMTMEATADPANYLTLLGESSELEEHTLLLDSTGMSTCVTLYQATSKICK